MKNRWGCNRKFQQNHSFVYRNDKIWYILLLFSLMLSIFMLFNIQNYLSRKYDKAHSENQLEYMKAAQIVFHKIAGNLGIAFDLENERIKAKTSPNRLLWFTSGSFFTWTLLFCKRNFKIKWFKNLLFSDLLQILIYYIYQSDGKKRLAYE